MGRFKAKKQDLFIDMTPMSDVMVLLLTFFMLTATFVKEEPIKVNTPGSVSEVKIPSSNLLTIFVEKNGKVYMTMDSPQGLEAMAKGVIEAGKLQLTPAEMETFKQAPMFGTPIDLISGWLDSDNRNDLLNDPKAGIPCDENGDELAIWVQAALDAIGDDRLRVAIKADKQTSYKVIKNVMNSLRRINVNRYNLITSLQGESN